MRNRLGAADQPGAVQDDAERPLLVVLDEQDHGPVKVGIRQQGSGDEQLRPEGVHGDSSALPTNSLVAE